MIKAALQSLAWYLIAVLGLCLGSPVTAAEIPGAGKPAAFTVKLSGEGRPMILIPGLGCGGDVWDGTVAHFEATHACHVVTLAGFAGQPAIDAPFLRQVRDGLIEYIREQKLERPILIGHSLGAFVAFSVSVEAPHQIGPVIAVDGVPFYPGLMENGTTPDRQKARAESLRRQIGAQAPMQFAIGNQLTLATMISKGADLEKVAATSSRSNPKAVGQALYELLTTDLREDVRSIKSPVLLLAPITPGIEAGPKQRMETSYSAQMAAIPNHKVVFVPESRHFIQLDQTEFFLREVESFLTSAEQDQER